MADSMKKIAFMRAIFQDMAECMLLGTGTSAGECAAVANRFASMPESIAHLKRIGSLALAARRKDSVEEGIRFFIEAIEADEALIKFMQCARRKLWFPFEQAVNDPMALYQLLGEWQILR